MALWNLVVRRVLFLVISSDRPFLCFLLYNTVQLILRGFLFILLDLSAFALMNWKTCNQAFKVQKRNLLSIVLSFNHKTNDFVICCYNNKQPKESYLGLLKMK